VVSHVARTVALLAQAANASGHAQAACSTADEHARVMRDTYTPIAEESGHDAPNAASRHVLDAQEALTEITNRLHDAVEALRTYAQRIAPGLAGALSPDSAYSPTGAELLDLARESAASKSRKAQWLDELARGGADISEAGHNTLDDVAAMRKEYTKMPDPPGPSSAIATQPRDPSTPAVTAAASEPSAGHVADIAVAIVTVALGARQFARRTARWLRS
jgi:hypothetical protein